MTQTVALLFLSVGHRRLSVAENKHGHPGTATLLVVQCFTSFTVDNIFQPPIFFLQFILFFIYGVIKLQY